MPTLCELAGAPLPNDYPGDGVSLWPVLSGKGKRTKDYVHIWYNSLNREKHTWVRNLDYGVYLDRNKGSYTYQKFTGHFSTETVDYEVLPESENCF